MKHWIKAARLRTLPLSVSGILVGSFYAMSQTHFNWKILGFALLTTIGLQVLSNFANDYGDGVKGTDNNDRIGPARAVQSGLISPKQMKNGMFLTAFFTFICAVLLIYVSFKDKYLLYSLLFLCLGIIAIVSAIGYTVGKKPYGYRGLGDLFVFVFFGFVSTLGVYFLYTKNIDWLLILPSSAIGLLSVGVLNLNNMRDIESDKKSGKITMAVKMGFVNAKKYHFSIISIALMLILGFAYLKGFAWDQYIFVIGFLPVFSHLLRVYKTSNPALLDPELKRLAIATFVISLLLSTSFIYLISDLIVRS